MEDRNDYRLAMASAFGFSGRIGEFADWLGFGVVPVDDDDEDDTPGY